MAENLNSQSDFFQLRPDMVINAVEASLREVKPGIRATGRAVALNSLENRVYEIEFENGDSVVTKFFRPDRWHADQILDEHDFLLDLIEAEVPVVAPLYLSDSELSQVVDLQLPTVAKIPTGLLFTVFPKVKGRIVDELDAEKVQILGRYIARIHAIGRGCQVEGRNHLTTDSYGWDALAFLYDSRSIDLTYESQYLDLAESFLEKIEADLEDVDTILVHGDCHLGNTLWHDLSPFFLDFDDCMFAPAVQDIWMAVPGFDEDAIYLREELLKGYSQFMDFDRDQLRLIEPLRGLRMIMYSAWIAQRWHDPLFQQTFQNFAEPSYWETEIRELKQVFRRI